MAKQLQFRRGTTDETALFVGALGEITVDTDKLVTVVHDGATSGGFPGATTFRLDIDQGDLIMRIYATAPANATVYMTTDITEFKYTYD